MDSRRRLIMTLISMSANSGRFPSALWSWRRSRAMTRHADFATAVALRGPWSIEAISPKIWPGRTVPMGVFLAKTATSPSRSRYIRFGMSRNGKPLWFSAKIFLPLAKVFGLPAERKNSSATAAL